MSEAKQEVTQHLYSLRDIAEMLVKKSDVHEGQWALSISFQIGVGSYGPSSDQTFPGAAITILNLGIQRHPPGTPVAPNGIIIDAAAVNPATSIKSGSSKKTQKKKR